MLLNLLSLLSYSLFPFLLALLALLYVSFGFSWCVWVCVLECLNKLSLGFRALLGLNASSQFILSGCILLILLLWQLGPCSLIFRPVLRSHGNKSGGLIQFCVLPLWIYFLFNGKFYEPKDGLAMGFPLVPTMPNCFMEHFEYQALNQVTRSSSTRPKYQPKHQRLWTDSSLLYFEILRAS
jgi:hypothetical protein